MGQQTSSVQIREIQDTNEVDAAPITSIDSPTTAENKWFSAEFISGDEADHKLKPSQVLQSFLNPDIDHWEELEPVKTTLNQDCSDKSQELGQEPQKRVRRRGRPPKNENLSPSRKSQRQASRKRLQEITEPIEIDQL